MGKLTANARQHIAPKNFAIPSRAPDSGSYPIHDISHAINALARVHQVGTPAEVKQVTAAVHRKYPSLQNVREKGKL